LPQVKVEGVSKYYPGLTALDHVSLDVYDGEYVSIIGPSGCGKTTLLRCIAGIIESDEGKIFVDNHSLTGVPPEERNLGYVFQEYALFPNMNAVENASYGPRVRGFSNRRIRNIAKDTLEMVKLNERSNARPNELSGGAKQKLALARAIGSAPSLLLLDEPLGSLDASVRLSLRLELRRLAKELRLTTIHVTHDQEEAMSISDRLVIIRSGRIVEVGEPQNLYLNPKQIFTANFLGEANFMRGMVIANGTEDTTLDIQGERLEIPRREIPKDALIAIRPQFVEVSKREKESEGWGGRIVDKSFLGDATRFDLELYNGLKVTARTPYVVKDIELDVGDEIMTKFQKDKILTFPYPIDGGLESELSTG
jgi:ABC-type Fe3+/spermidine/putrescine transport system ATPase subunit